MANKRMIARRVIQSDEFLDMSFPAQALFFQLQIDADEFGYIDSPRRVARATGVESSCLTELETAGFLNMFSSGVGQLAHWDIANTRDKNSAKEPRYKAESSQLKVNENGVYVKMSAEELAERAKESDGIGLNQTESDGIGLNQSDSVISCSPSRSPKKAIKKKSRSPSRSLIDSERNQIEEETKTKRYGFDELANLYGAQEGTRRYEDLKLIYDEDVSRLNSQSIRNVIYALKNTGLNYKPGDAGIDGLKADDVGEFSKLIRLCNELAR